MFAKIQNNQVVEWPIYNIKAVFPNISFPDTLTDANLPAGYVTVGTSAPPVAALNQKVVPSTPVLDGNVWLQGWEIVELSESEILEKRETIAQDVRSKRDMLISETDWIVMKAYEQQMPVGKEWLDYRQELRDISSQVGFPHEINWPNRPRSFN
jgi:hypothetical protein